MATGRSQFIGAAGQFYLAYGLAVREINASLTPGNAPSVDILASSHDGRHTLSFQVKTSRNAYRRNRYGSEGYEWDVGAGVIGKHRESFWYAFSEKRHKVKFTKYFLHIRQSPDRAKIRIEWIEDAIRNPACTEIKSDGRIKKWKKIEE